MLKARVKGRRGWWVLWGAVKAETDPWQVTARGLVRLSQHFLSPPLVGLLEGSGRKIQFSPVCPNISEFIFKGCQNTLPMRAIKHQKCVLSWVWGLEVRNQGVSRANSLRRLQGKSLTCFTQLLAPPWLVTSLQSYLQHHMALFQCVSACPFLSQRDTCDWI